MQERDYHHEPHKDLDPQLVSAYTASFISRKDVYPIQLPNGTYVAVKKNLSDRFIESHLHGHITIGAYALDNAGWSKWICFDADDDKWFGKLVDVSANLAERDVPSYLEHSRRGGHLWIFMPTVPGFQARRFGYQITKEFNLTKATPKISGVELYPKQDKLETGPGSCVRLPFGIHRLTGKRYHFIHPDGTPLAPTTREQIAILANPARASQAFIDQVLEKAPSTNEISPTPPFQLSKDITGKVSDRIKHRISVPDFVGQYVSLDERGKGNCPFHNDTVKSFQVSRQGNYWHCYAGCGGGSVIDFWMKWRETHGQGSSFKETIKELAALLQL